MLFFLTHLSEILIKITKLFIHENASENVVCQIGGHFVQGGEELYLLFKMASIQAASVIDAVQLRSTTITTRWKLIQVQIEKKGKK